MPTVALATCREFPQLDDEDRLVLPELERLGIYAVPAVWTDDDVAWETFDAVVLRETWDYSDQRPTFLDWSRRVSAVSRLWNPAAVVEWNTDKRYLRDLDAAGMPVVPTVFLEPGDDAAAWQPPQGFSDFVVKPAVSAGSRDTMRYSASDGLVRAREHADRLLLAGRAVMVQPYLDAVDTLGETAVLFIGGEFSHAIRKGPLLERDVEGARVEGLFVQEQIDARTPSDDELAIARAIVDCIPGGFESVLYARVDLIPDQHGRPHLLELELVEPSLFLSHADGAPARLAAAIAARLDSEGGSATHE